MNSPVINIMYLVDTYEHPYAGTEKQLYTLISGLDKEKFNTAMTLLRHSQYIEKNGFPCPVNILDIKKLFSLTSLFKIIGFAFSLKNKNYKIVHIFFNDASIIAPIILRIFGLKVIVSRRDMGFWYTRTNLAVLRLNRYFINAVIANSEAVGLITHEKETVPLERIHVIYNGYALDKISAHSQNEMNNFPVLMNKTKKIGIVANIRPIKRIDDLIRAFHLVKDKMPDTELIVVGAGENRHLLEIIHDLQLDNSVHFFGGQNNAIAIIKHFDVAVLCSETEGFSNAIIEYMWCRVPVVCTDTGGNRELVDDGETGYLVPVGDIDGLANRICTVLDAPEEKITKMTQKAHKHIYDICDADKMISSHAVIYNTL